MSSNMLWPHEIDFELEKKDGQLGIVVISVIPTRVPSIFKFLFVFKEKNIGDLILNYS